jgi:acid phosphatase type 7
MLARRIFFVSLVLAGSCAGQPLLRIADSELPASPVVIAYGDMRFTDPKETSATDPKVRRWIIDRIAEEKPNAVLLSGDVPWHGGEANDYVVYRSETAPWGAAHIFVSPALGNHELFGKTEQSSLENWWNAFPALRGHRWYSVALGSRIFVLNLDSNSSLLPGSEQMRWIRDQLASLPPSVKFVFLNLHHPPMADFQVLGDPDHNARPNEIALAAFLKAAPEGKRVCFIVTAGHIHNYERFLQDGITYLVSGGGGAAPRPIHRHPNDLYQDAAYPNYHYVKFVLRENRLEAEMFRVAHPADASATWEVKDRFIVPAASPDP